MEKNTRKLSYPILFERLGFPRFDDLIECAAATRMQKMVYNLEPMMIIELIKFPRSRSICRISPKTMPNSARLKCTAINSAIACLNKADIALTGLAPVKFNKGLSKVTLKEKASEEILKDLNKSIEKKTRPIINKKYPGFKPKSNDDGLSSYKDLVNLFDPPEEYTLEERISEMEEHLNSILN